ncbi:hypothetical protein C1X73_23080 [Pseudomonas sp. FW305-130]|nr:hypothetical protein C1X73_23080 [Pseudomonas sp. FW305-130]
MPGLSRARPPHRYGTPLRPCDSPVGAGVPAKGPVWLAHKLLISLHPGLSTSTAHKNSRQRRRVAPLAQQGGAAGAFLRFSTGARPWPIAKYAASAPIAALAAASS